MKPYQVRQNTNHRYWAVAGPSYYKTFGVGSYAHDVAVREAESLNEAFQQGYQHGHQGRVFTRPFMMRFTDPTADDGEATIRFDPSFDRVPSTGEPVNTYELGWKYWHEIIS
jgi:hypothetical protein